jgi:hypothetical protein
MRGRHPDRRRARQVRTVGPLGQDVQRVVHREQVLGLLPTHVPALQPGRDAEQSPGGPDRAGTPDAGPQQVVHRVVVPADLALEPFPQRGFRPVQLGVPDLAEPF